jgi:glycerol transport system ATP-binding protein
MSLKLQGVTQQVGGVVHLHPLDLALAPGQINVVLGTTLAGKTSLLRVMAGLDPPTRGRVLDHGQDVTGMSVRGRNLAMVYQQFINYPSLTVRENIASPLQCQRRPATEVRARVAAIADSLRLTPFLDRRPAELSGGQQQRTALARALAKDAELLLLDEPLVNLDYKLREELRAELLQLLRERSTTVVYATTEPLEALQLGGQLLVLVEGRLLQAGPTLEVFHRPASLAAARAFSDPPLNVMPAVFDAATGTARVLGHWDLPLAPEACNVLRTQGIQELLLALRPHQFSAAPRGAQHCALEGPVVLAELSGSDTYLHLRCNDVPLVGQFPGIHAFTLGALARLYLDPRDFLGFSLQGATLFAPPAGGATR